MGGLSFLIVDDDLHVQRALRLALGRYGLCSSALSRETAERELQRSWDGFVIDVRLQDGSGLDVLATLRSRGIRAPAVVLSGAIDHETVNSTVKLDARLVSKPCGIPELGPFVSDVVLHKTNDRVYAARERARNRWYLTDRETEVLEAALRGTPRDRYLEASRMAHNTFKTHVKRLLDKSDYENLSRLVIDLLNEQ